ncbi:MAG: S-methyl-5-thioribose-1-phosphate isomerase [Candidatus Zixiibacteriota bacterium]|nr:MAG: S-methyl-5-thioribose-1-phosphate isomerase [candidate division Zixibacteria bacterium]
MPLATIEWIGGLGGEVRLIDQTLLPTELKYISCSDTASIWQAIKRLSVRGAPAIGIAAAFGTVLGVRGSKASNFDDFSAEMKRATEYLGSSRPTAVNLFWALDRMTRIAQQHQALPVAQVKERLLEEALTIMEEDKAICRKIGSNGAELVADGATLLTHCNAGGLATADYGTALAVIFAAHEQGKNIHVFADETRPLLQGARLTTWELLQAGVDVTLICDNMAGLVMKQGKIDCVVVGADRIAANGDTANKIGTYSVAVLAKEHGIPFYVAAPVSTFDLALTSGAQIPIEERGAEEITCGFGKRIAPETVKTYCPAFDVTPAKYISAIITEQGIIRQPTEERIRATLGTA